MDLIQEDMPGEEQANEGSDRMMAANSVVQSSYMSGNIPTMVQQPQQQGLPTRFVSQTNNHQGMFQLSSQSINGYPAAQQSRTPLPQGYNSNMDNLNYGMQNMSMLQNNPNNNSSPVYMEPPRSQMPQQYAQTGFDVGNNSSMNNVYGGLNSPQMRLSNQQAHMVQLQQPQSQQSRLYYQQSPQPSMDVQPPRLQAQMLPNGQTIYLQAPPQPTPNVGYTFAPVAAPAAPPTQLYQRSDGQYVSVVSVQQQQQQPQQQPPSPQTMTFWQADGTTGQAVLVTGGSGGTGATLTPTMSHGLLNHQDVPAGGPGRGGGGGGRHGKGVGGGGGGGRRGRSDRNVSRRGEGKGGNTGIASPVLEEFRSNKNRQWTIAHIEGSVVEFCQDQNGSRFIQQRLEMGDLTEQRIVAREILPSIRRLRNDVFGNYVVQKLLDFGSPEVRSSIRETLEGEMMQLSLQMYGCRVVQKALETLSEDDLSHLLQEFHHNVLSCIYDQNGNHVIQKCIEVFNARAKRALSQGDKQHAESLRRQLDFIISDVVVNAASLACHPYGCRVLQRILEHCEDDTKHTILDQVQPSHKRLLDDQYGNYVIQHVLQYGRTSDRNSILQIVVDAGLLGLSRQKFASNVVEKLLKYGNSNHRRAIAAEMLHRVHDASIANQSPEGTSVLLLMVRDAYANYVVQTTLDVIPESEEKTALLRELKAHSDELVRLFVMCWKKKMLTVFHVLICFLTRLLSSFFPFPEKLYICQAYCFQTC
jgi:pumilio RNA-binding family